MSVEITKVAQLGALAKIVRRDQSLEQGVAGMLAGSGSTFISQFENGKESVEMGRVFALLHELGIKLDVKLPPNLSTSAKLKIGALLGGAVDKADIFK